VSLSQPEQLEFSIDLDLREVTQDIDEFQYEQPGLYLLSAELLYCLLRGAWGVGYTRGATEPVRGEFAKAHGYRLRRPL
jgi:hypothetical protein